jgi:hypothetical protein
MPNGSWLAAWTPEDDGFWQREGKSRAWTTLMRSPPPG